jgi:hypothetical protein
METDMNNETRTCGMFSAEGNAAVVQRLDALTEAIKLELLRTSDEIRVAVDNLFAAVARNHPEVYDTAVREEIWADVFESSEIYAGIDYGAFAS